MLGDLMSRAVLSGALLSALALTPLTALAQDEGEQQKQPGQELIEKLREVERLMRDIEQDLAKAGVGPERKRHEQIRRYIEEQLKAGRKQDEVRAELEKLMNRAGEMSTAGKSMDEIRAELEKLMDRSCQSCGQAAGQIAKLLEQKQKMGGASQAIERLIESQGKGEQAAEKLEHLFKQACDAQSASIQKLDKIIESAKPGT